MLHGRLNHPLVGRGNRPDITALALELPNQMSHLGKNLLNEVLVKEFFGEALHLNLGKPAVDGHHFAAHVTFRDFAGFVVGVARPHPAFDVTEKHTSLELPVKKALTGIPRPQRAVAIKHRELRTKIENRVDKIRRRERRVWSQLSQSMSCEV